MHRIEPPTERFTTDLERTPLVLLAEDDGDTRMPFFTGLDALESSLKTHLDAPIVLISAFCDPATVSRALEAGAAALLPKPVEPEALLETLESLSGLRATLPSA